MDGFQNPQKYSKSYRTFQFLILFKKNFEEMMALKEIVHVHHRSDGVPKIIKLEKKLSAKLFPKEL